MLLRKIFREGLYLRRWYLWGAPKMADGSSPLNEDGTVKDAAIWPDFGIYLHAIHKPDAECDLHNHPWRWCVAIILWGGYEEERLAWLSGRTKGWYWPAVIRRVLRPFSINWLTPADYHRIDKLRGKVSWSLFITGPRFQEWGFFNRETFKFTPIKEYRRQRNAT
jgi:hypothetical protein